jgi:hypothetical protein
MAYLTGETLGVDPGRADFATAVSVHPFETVYLPLNYSGNPGVNVDSHRGEQTRDISANMYSRASGRFSQPYPYGSEFAFDTTGQVRYRHSYNNHRMISDRRC